MQHKNIVIKKKFLYRYGQDDEDEDQIEAIARFQYTDMRAQQPKYDYVNSDRDFTLPLQKHKNNQPLYESPEEGKHCGSYFYLTVVVFKNCPFINSKIKL